MMKENTVDAAETQRPKIAAEVRAWIVVAVALVVQGMGAVWWAATLSAEMKALRDVVADLKQQIASSYTANDAARDLSGIRGTIGDHEARLRAIELRR
jgi:hypothetical protein